MPSLAGRSGQTIVRWVRSTHRPLTAPYTLVTKAYSNIAINDPSTYESGRKEPRVVRFGSVRRAMSDISGQLDRPSARVSFSDTDRAIRTIALDHTYKGQEMLYSITDDTSRRAAVESTMLGRFAQQSPQWSADHTVTIAGDDFLTSEFGAAYWSADVPRTRITSRLFPNIDSDSPYLNKAAPNIYGIHDDASPGYGPIPVLPIADGYSLDGFPYCLLLIMEGVAEEITAAWLGTDDVGSGTDILIPGWTSWNNRAALKVGGVAVKYYAIAGRWFTPVFASSTLWEKFRSGSLKMTVAMKGVEDSAAGDGTGTVYTSIFDQWKHWMINRVVGDQKTAPLANPTYASDGLTKIKTTSFDTAKTLSEARMGGGYLGAWRVGPEPVSLGNTVAMLSRSGDAPSFITARGRFAIDMFNPAATSAATFARYGAAGIVRQQSVNVQTDDSQHWNFIPYRYGRLYSRTGWQIDGAHVRDPVSIEQYGRTYEASPVELDAVRTEAQGRSIALYRLQRHAHPPMYVTFGTDLGMLDRDLGDVVTLDHPLAPTPDGTNSRSVYLTEMTVDLDALTVQVKGLDHGRVGDHVVPGAVAVTITSAGLVATVTHTGHQCRTEDVNTIVLASPAGYNGSKEITVTDADHYTYALQSALASPATGTPFAITGDLGQTGLEKKKVDEQDGPTGTGPIPGGFEQFVLGTWSGVSPSPADTWRSLPLSLPQTFDRGQIGDRTVLVRGTINIAGGATLTVRLGIVGGGAIGGELSTTSATDVTDTVDVTGSLEEGEKEYEVQYKVSTTTDIANIRVQLEILG